MAERWLARLARVEERESGTVLWAVAWFFLIFTAWNLVKPVREEMGVAGGVSALPWMFTATLLGTLAANPLYAAAASRLRRAVLVPATYRFIALSLLVAFVLLRVADDAVRVHVARGFFVWASVLNLFAVSVFWSFLADSLDSGVAKRLYGLIGLGGTSGAIAGSALATVLAPRVGPEWLLVGSAALFEAGLVAQRRLAQATLALGPRSPDVEASPPARDALEGFRLVLRSPYLLGIAGVLMALTVSATFLYFEQARIVKAAFADKGERTAFFARIDLLVNVATLLLQAFASGRVVSFLGVGRAMAVLPLVTVGGFFALAARPDTAVLLLVQVARRSADYAIARPAREVLFTVVSRAEKYPSKAFLDTFVYRGGDAVGAWTETLLRTMGLGNLGLALAFVPVAIAWSALCLALGRAHERRR